MIIELAQHWSLLPPLLAFALAGLLLVVAALSRVCDALLDAGQGSTAE